METQQRSRQVNYTVNVPETRTRSYNVTLYDNVTEQVPENYTVCVPVQTMRAVQVRVCRQVPTTVSVPVYGGGAIIDSGASYGGGVISEGAVIGGGAPMATGAGCVNCN
jgi:hypothetical protein